MVSDIFKDGWTDHGRTNKGDYYGPHQVNPGSKISLGYGLGDKTLRNASTIRNFRHTNFAATLCRIITM